MLGAAALGLAIHLLAAIDAAQSASATTRPAWLGAWPCLADAGTSTGATAAGTTSTTGAAGAGAGTAGTLATAGTASGS